MAELLEEIEKRLNAKTIHDLRQVARAVGVPRPADGKKDRVVDYILQIATGKADPAAPAVRGAPPKSPEYDRDLVKDILRCRETFLFSQEPAAPEKPLLTVSGGDLTEFKAGGVLEKIDGKWFARTGGNRSADIFVNEKLIARYSLRSGDLVTGLCKRAQPDEMAGLVNIESVNGYPLNALPERCDFASLGARYPEKRLLTSTEADLLAPLAAGQRAAVCGAHGSGKTYFIKRLINGVTNNHPQLKIIIILVDARPEEAEDFKTSFPRADLFCSQMDAGAAAHVSCANLALEYAKRQVELSADVLVVIDSLTSLARAFGQCSAQPYGAAASDGAKRFLAAAKNAGDRSLTVLAALDTEGGFESELYSSLAGLCSMRVTLSKKLALARAYPPIDVAETHTSGDERLLSEEELKKQKELYGR